MTSPNHPSVIVVNGAEAGTVLHIDEVLNDFVVGSDEGCHLVLSSTSVSPMHAAIFLDDEGGVTVSDTKSRAGVYVNGNKVTEHALSDGDEISLGPPDHPDSGRLRFAASGAEAPLVDLSEPEPLGLTGLEDLQAPSVEEGVFTTIEASPSEPAFDPVPALVEFAPATVDAFPPPEMPSEPELQAAPVPTPEPEPAPAPVKPTPAAVPPAKATPARPKTGAKPEVALVNPAPPRPDARKTTPRVSAPEDADDPLAGLAESLGGSDGERFVPPPVEVAAPSPKAAAKKSAMSSPVMAARIAAIAALLGGLAWFGLQKYSESIAVPVVDTYVPNPVEPGQTLTINGSGFGSAPDPTIVKVLLGSVEAQVLDANPTRINVTVPESLGVSGSQTLPLTVEAQKTTSTGRLLKVSVIPKIAALVPRVALTGDEVAISGKWFANAKTKPVVTVAGNAAEVLDATPSQIRIKIPAVTATEGQRVSVRVAVGPETSKEALLNYGRLPFVETVSPERALPGDIITLTGLGLSGPDLSIAVGSRSAAVLSSSETEVKFSLPGLRLSESAGPRGLAVKANESSSAPHTIEILRESAALYSPRFFVEILEGGRAAVSCEIGPVMVLGSDAPSRKRAHDAAVRLNALASGGRTNRVQFTAGDATINAPGGPVLVVASGDASGNSRAMASLWAAHLTDLFDLFLQGRRPGRVVELSPDGKALLDIFAAARRRSTEPGVPQGVLSSPDPAWVRSLASLAAAPALGSGQALALLDGYWAGLIEVPGAIQPRKVEISLTVTPSGLVGQSTSRQGRLSSDITLRNLTYARRELRFSFVDSGEELVYQGRLDGDLIDGTVTKATGARVGKLTFKLTR